MNSPYEIFLFFLKEFAAIFLDQVFWVVRCYGHPMVSGWNLCSKFGLDVKIWWSHTRIYKPWVNGKVYYSHNEVSWTFWSKLGRLSSWSFLERQGKETNFAFITVRGLGLDEGSAQVGQVLLWFKYLASAKGGHTQFPQLAPLWSRRGKSEAWKKPNTAGGVRPFITIASLPLSVSNSMR